VLLVKADNKLEYSVLLQVLLLLEQKNHPDLLKHIKRMSREEIKLMIDHFGHRLCLLKAAMLMI
jgi:hypothetical protein